MYKAQAAAPEDEEAVEMQGLPVPHGPDQRGAETRGRQGGSPLNGTSGACVSGRVEPTAHGDPRGVDVAKRQLCKGRGEKPFVSRIPERALGSRKADDGEIVTDGLARMVGRSDMQQKLQADGSTWAIAMAALKAESSRQRRQKTAAAATAEQPAA